MRRLVFALAAAAGCTGVQSNPAGVDAAPDVPDEIDAPVVLTAHHYVIDSQLIPQTNNQAGDVALDLDNNAAADNQLGAVMATFAGMGFDVQGPATADVDRGAALSLVAFESNGFTNSPASFTLFTGSDPDPAACTGGADTVCRHHLAGTGTFAIPGTSARDTPLLGMLAGGIFVSQASPNSHLQLQTNLLTGTTVTLNLVGARAKVTMPSNTGIMSGSINGAIPTTDINTKLLPAWQQAFDAAMVADCPGAAPTCGCTPSSQGEVLHELFDTSPQNCRISLAELAGNSLIQGLTAPDVDIDGESAVSIAIGFTATKATFTP